MECPTLAFRGDRGKVAPTGKEITMAEHKGKPSGKYAETKISPGRKGDYKRSGWPEDAATQRVETVERRNAGKRSAQLDRLQAGEGRGRNRKAGSPV